MATIAKTAVTGIQTDLTETTLTSSDTFVYTRNKRAMLVLRNDTGGALTVTIDGDGAGSINVGGVGLVDISGGYSTGEIAVGESVAILLDKIDKYLDGTIAVTGGTGITATLIEF